MADKITNDITLLFKTKLDEKSKQEVGKNLKGLLENAAIGFDEAETKRNLEPIVNMMKRLFDKAEIAFDADKLLAMPSRQALEEMAKMEVNQLQMAFDKALAKSGGVKIDFGDIGLSELAAPLKQIEGELSNISSKIADTTKKSVYEIEQSLKSISKNKKLQKIASPESIENALLESSNDKKIHPSGAVSTLEKARDLYEASVKEDNPWVVQYKYLLDFVSKYEKLTHQAKTKIESERPEFKQLYDMLSPKAGAVKISLEHYVDVARGSELSEYKNQPWGRESTLKEIRDTLKNGISVKEGSGDGNSGNKNDNTPPWEDPKPKNLNTKVPNIDNADVNATEQAKKAEEALANARRVSAKKIYRTIYSPLDEENLSREERKSQYGGAEIWTSSFDVANTYADGEDDPVMLKGSLSANNAYIIDAKGATWKDFGKMKVLTPDSVDQKGKVQFSTTMLRDEFPELFKRIDNGEFSYEEDIQAELYKAIKSLGYDALVTQNVVDAKDIEGYKEPSTIYAVFDDNALEVLSAYAVEEQDENGTTSFEKKARRENIPEYYKMPEHTQVETNSSLTKEVTLLEKIQNLTTYIDDNYLSTGKHLSDFLDDVQRESNELDGELKEILTTLNLIDDKGNLNFDIKRNGEAGGGTTHNGALISDDFVLIERGNYNSVKNSMLPDSTQNAAKDGINVAEVLGYLPSKHTGGFFDVQGTAMGHNLFEDGVLSQDVVNATDEQLEQLVNAFIKARDYGFDIENGGSNIVYDKEKGFSFYDLEELSTDEAEFWNSKTEAEKKLIAIENVFSLFSGINRDHSNFDNDDNVGVLAERIKGVVENKGIIDPDVVDDMGRNYEDIYDDVFSGDIDEDYNNVIAALHTKADAHKENTAAIKAEEHAQEEANQSFLDGVLAAARAKAGLKDAEIDSREEIAAEKAETDAINQQNEALKENIDFKAKANVQDDDVIVDADVGADATKPSSSSAEVKASIDTEELRGLLNSITYNVKVVQDAEPAEDNKVSINADELRSVLDSITYNVKLAQGESDGDSNKIAIDEGILENVLNRITYDVKIAHDDSDKTSNKIAIDESALESTLNRVFGNILTPKDDGEKPEGKKEPWALEKTLNTTIKGVLDQIQTNTAKVDASSDTTGTSEFTTKLTEIKSILESINSKIIKGGVIATRGAVKQAGSQSVEPDVKRQAARSNMMKSLINDYKTMGKLAAQFASDGNLETKAMLENFKEEIRRKRASLNITMDENASLREKYSIAFEAEKRLLEAEEQQKKINEQNKADAKAEKKRLADAKKLAQREAMVGKAGNAVGRAENTWMAAVGMEDELPKEFGAQIDDYYQKLDALRKKQAELKNSDTISEEQKSDLIAQTNNVNKLTEEISGLIAEYQRLSGDNVDPKTIRANTIQPGANMDTYEQQLKNYVREITYGKGQIKGFNAETQTLTYTVKTGAHEFTTYTAAVRHLDDSLVSVRGATKKTETFLEATARKMKEISSYMSGMALLSRVGQELRRGIQYVREIDLALTELKKVTNETEESYDKFLETAAKTADKVGSTIQKVISSTADWARLNI